MSAASHTTAILAETRGERIDEGVEAGAVLAGDEVDAAPGWTSETEDGEVGAQRRHHQVRYQRHAESGRRHTRLADQVVGAEGDPGLEARPGSELAHHHLRADVVLDPRLAGEQAHVDPPRVGQRVGGRGDDDRLVVAQVHGAQLRVARQSGRGVGDDGGVELAGGHHRTQVGGDP
jgi:hypothetical protein